MKPQVVAHDAEQAARRRRDRLGDSGTITTWAARHIDMRDDDAVLALGHRWRRWPTACPTASAPRSPIPDRQVVCVRRRRRLHDADGRDRDAGEVQAAGQGRHHQEQRARADQVGADGLRGQPGVRRRAAADRLRSRTPRPAAPAASPIDDPDAGRRRLLRGASIIPGRRWSSGGRSERAAACRARSRPSRRCNFAEGAAAGRAGSLGHHQDGRRGHESGR